MAVKKTTAAQTASENATEAGNGVESAQAIISAPTGEKGQENADTYDTEETFIYIGPTTRTGLVENTIVKGTRDSVEEYLKGTIEKIPQAKHLVVATKDLAKSREKVRQAGTLLNKYYNDVLSLSGKAEEG